MKIATCRSCGAEIVWLTNQTTGRKAPIDAQPVENGNIVVSPEDETYRVATKGERGEKISEKPRRDLHTNHFVTCPEAKNWHKAKP